MPARKVLLVESDPFVAEEVSGFLRDAGDEVALASSDGALTVAIERSPDLALIRAELEGATGYAVCDALKADPRTERVPVVVYASDPGAVEADDHRYGATRADGYLTWPFSHGTLLDELELLTMSSAMGLVEVVDEASLDMVGGFDEAGDLDLLVDTDGLLADLDAPLPAPPPAVSETRDDEDGATRTGPLPIPAEELEPYEPLHAPDFDALDAELSAIAELGVDLDSPELDASDLDALAGDDDLRAFDEHADLASDALDALDALEDEPDELQDLGVGALGLDIDDEIEGLDLGLPPPPADREPEREEPAATLPLVRPGVEEAQRSVTQTSEPPFAAAEAARVAPEPVTAGDDQASRRGIASMRAEFALEQKATLVALAESKQTAGALEAELAAARREAAAARLETEGLQVELDRARRERDEARGTSDRQHSLTEEHRAAVQEALRATSEAAEFARQDADAAQRQVQELLAEAAQARDLLDDAETARDQAAAALAESEARAGSLGEELAWARSAISAAATAQAEVAGVGAQLASRLEEAEAAAEAAEEAEEAALAALGAQAAEAEAAQAEAMDRAAELQAELDRMIEAERHARGELEAAMEHAAKLKERLDDAEARVSDLEAGATAAALAGGELEDLRLSNAELDGRNQLAEKRLLRALQRMKTDDRVRAQATKAVRIALSLLERVPDAGKAAGE